MPLSPRHLPTALVVCLLGGVAVTGCGEKTYSKGDCVKIKMHLVDQEMKSSDCPGVGAFTPQDPVYKVDEVIDHKGGNCIPQGFGAVQFSDEPADKTYCLSFASR